MEISETETDERTTPGPPHEALFLALAYLPALELLAMSEVCSSLRDSVKNDVLPWLNIVVERPLNKRLCDQTLMLIAAMAKGKLRTLSLLGCSKITDDGLQSVVYQNPLLNQLLVPGCTSLTPEGVIRAMKTLSENGHTFKKLWINGIYNIKKHHLETLFSYLQIPTSKQRLKHHIDNEPVIDLQICPRCDQPRVVIDCPRKSCEIKKEKSTVMDCRGCSFCIPRCIECDVCFNEFEAHEEAVCGDELCPSCWLQLPKCSFCNKPYCTQHVEEKPHCSSGSAGFVCDACHDKSVERLYDSNEE